MSISLFLDQVFPNLEKSDRERFLKIFVLDGSTSEHALSAGPKVNLPVIEFNKEKVEEGISWLKEKGLTPENEAWLRQIIKIEEGEMEIHANDEAESLLLLLRSTDFSKKTIDGCFALLDAKEGDEIRMEPVLDLMREGIKRPQAMPIIMALVTYLSDIYGR